MSELRIDGKPYAENPQLLLLDKDGTLVDIHHYWTGMIRLRAELAGQRWFGGSRERPTIEAKLMEAMGIDTLSGRMKPQGPVGIKPRSFIVQVAAGVVQDAGVGVSEEEMEDLFGDIDRATAQDMLPLLRLLPGVMNLLEQARQCGVSLAIVSTDITERAGRSLRALGIDDYFTAIVGADAVLHTKPAPDLAELVLRGGYDRERTIVIGDHPVDVQMGLNAGVRNNIGVLTGLSTADMFMPYECAVVKDLTSLQIAC